MCNVSIPAEQKAMNVYSFNSCLTKGNEQGRSNLIEVILQSGIEGRGTGRRA